LPINERRIAKLSSLGLSTYEARVYLALLDLGQAPARRLAEVSGVPQTRLYETCRALHEKGLLEETLKKPKEYRAVPISKFLDNVARDYERQVRTLQTERSQWEDEFRVTGAVQPRATGTFLTYHGLRRVLERSRLMFEGARESVLVRASPCTMQRLRPLLQEIPDLSRVDVKVAHHVTAETAAYTEAVAAMAQVRHAQEPNPISFVTVDSREGMLYHWDTSGEDGHERDVALWTDDPELVAGFEQSIHDTWSQSLPLEERLRQIRTGAPARFTKMMQGHYSGRQVVDLLVPKVKRGASLIVSEGGLRRLSQSQSFMDLLQRARIRILAPVTTKNLNEARIMAQASELRHLPFWFGQNHVLVDDELAFVTTYIQEGKTLETTDLLNSVQSNEPGIVEAERKLFEGLWSIGSPLERRAAELTKGAEYLRTTREPQQVIAWVHEGLREPHREAAFMTTAAGLARILNAEFESALDAEMRVRLIAPITPDNLPHAERLAARMEVRHHPDIHQAQVILDQDRVVTTYFAKDADTPEEAEIFSVNTNSGHAAEMALTLFDALWEKALPLEERVAELRHGHAAAPLR